MKHPVKITENQSPFQIGRSVLVVSVQKPWNPWKWFTKLLPSKNKDKSGLVSLNGRDYFPKEYLEVEERQGNTNFVDNISSYFRNMLLGNPFNSRPQNRLDSESQSENESHISDRENNEEGKSLMDDFNQRAPLQLSDSHRHNNSVDSEAHEEQNDQSNRSQNRIIFPQIISERSQQSHSSDFINVDSRNIRLINPLNSSNRSGSSISEQDNPRIEFMQINQQLSKDNSEEIKINQIVHESHNKSAPKLNPPKPNPFENKYNAFDSQSESNSRNNKLFQIESEAKKYEPIIPFHEYSNASKMMRSKPNNIDVLPKLSFNKHNHLDTNYSKSFEIVKSSEKLKKLDKNQISFEQHKNWVS